MRKTIKSLKGKFYKMQKYYERKDKKACLKEKGEQNFGFYEFHEICVYKYAVGMDMSKKEYKEVGEHNQFNSYEEWENGIRKKYEKLNLATCLEFKKFLMQKFRNMKTSNSTLIMMMNSIFSGVISVLIGFIVGQEIDISTNDNPLMMAIPILVIPFLVSAGLYWLIYRTIQPFWKDNEDSSFYEDFITVYDFLT